ncbi:MAG: signal peptidase I [Myxococcota bacterium]
MSISLAHVFDFRLRNARKSARHQVREAGRLLRRAGESLSEPQRAEVRDAMAATRQSLRDGDRQELGRTSERLASVVDKLLDGYRKPAWRESMESIGVAVLVALLLRAFVVEAFKIPSGSMIPTLAIGDQIFVNKYVYGLRIPFTSIRLVDFSVPNRGDVIVFICPEPPNEDYIKRVVGLAGDEIEVREGLVYVNGTPLGRTPLGADEFIDRDTATSRWYPFEAYAFHEKTGDKEYTVIQDRRARHAGSSFGPVTVPQGHVFVMGDNRDHSSDSRFWGPVPLSNILGRSLFVWWSWGRDGLQWGRLGTWIR